MCYLSPILNIKILLKLGSQRRQLQAINSTARLINCLPPYSIAKVLNLCTLYIKFAIKFPHVLKKKMHQSFRLTSGRGDASVLPAGGAATATAAKFMLEPGLWSRSRASTSRKLPGHDKSGSSHSMYTSIP